MASCDEMSNISPAIFDGAPPLQPYPPPYAQPPPGGSSDGAPPPLYVAPPPTSKTGDAPPPPTTTDGGAPLPPPTTPTTPPPPPTTYGYPQQQPDGTFGDAATTSAAIPQLQPQQQQGSEFDAHGHPLPPLPPGSSPPSVPPAATG